MHANVKTRRRLLHVGDGLSSIKTWHDENLQQALLAKHITHGTPHATPASGPTLLVRSTVVHANGNEGLYSKHLLRLLLYELLLSSPGADEQPRVALFYDALRVSEREALGGICDTISSACDTVGVSRDMGDSAWHTKGVRVLQRTGGGAVHVFSEEAGKFLGVFPQDAMPRRDNNGLHPQPSRELVLLCESTDLVIGGDDALDRKAVLGNFLEAATAHAVRLHGAKVPQRNGTRVGSLAVQCLPADGHGE